MKTKVYQKPTTKVVKLQHQCHIMAGSVYTTTTGLNAMDGDEVLGDGAQSDGNSLWSMGADEDL